MSEAAGGGDTHDRLEREKISVVGLQGAQVDRMRVLTRGGARGAPTRRRRRRPTSRPRSRWPGGRGAGSWCAPRRSRSPSTSTSSPEAVRERAIGTKRLIDVVEALEEKHVPVVVTGDMNARDELFCRVVGLTSLVSPAGGWLDESCSPPEAMHIDRITDHTVPVVTASPGRRAP